MSLLMADGVEKDQAREIVRAALKDRRKGKRKGAGGQSGQTDEVTLADDMCEDFEITCSGKRHIAGFLFVHHLDNCSTPQQ